MRADHVKTIELLKEIADHPKCWHGDSFPRPMWDMEHHVLEDLGLIVQDGRGVRLTAKGQ